LLKNYIETTDLGAKDIFFEIIKTLGEENDLVILMHEYEMAVQKRSISSESILLQQIKINEISVGKWGGEQFLRMEGLFKAH
jgi:hypothetical protein